MLPKLTIPPSEAPKPIDGYGLPDAENVVIIEGVARLLSDAELSAAEWAELDGAYAAKYGTQGSPRWVVEPRLVLAWAGVNLGTMTRWRFE